MLALIASCLLVAAAETPMTDGEVWNEGVDYFRAGDVTNALRVLRPLMLSKSHGPRAAEIVAKLEYDRGNQEEAANAAQIALRAAPTDERANRNFTRATDGLPQQRETAHINAVLKAAQGKDPGAMLLAATKDARRLMQDAGSYRTNAPARRVAMADALAKRAETLADVWIPVREVIAQSVTNEDQAATIVQQIEQAQAKTKKAARELGDLADGSYGTVADVEHDFTRFLKLTVMPPAAMACATSAFDMAFAGAMYMHRVGYVPPDTFQKKQSVLFLTMLLFGGTGTMFGPIIGVISVELLIESLRSLQEFQGFVYGILLLIVIVALPGGLYGGLRDIYA